MNLKCVMKKPEKKGNLLSFILSSSRILWFVKEDEDEEENKSLIIKIILIKCHKKRWLRKILRCG